MKGEKILFRVLLAMLVGSMAVTEGLLVIQGRWQEAIPLHLCSVSAIAAAGLACASKQFLLDFLWYLGMPGALLALLFPAPASSICQPLLNSSYLMTHALILAIPLFKMAYGMRPQPGKTPQMMLSLIVLSGIAAGVNGILKTDFLFLSSPPAGTPLEVIFQFGYPLYIFVLFTLMLLCCMGMDTLAKGLLRKAVQ